MTTNEKYENSDRADTGEKNAERAKERAESTPTRRRKKELGTNDGAMDRSTESKEAALAKVKQSSKGYGNV